MIKKILLDQAVQLKIEREKRKITQSQLSEITGIPQSTISKIEKGRNTSTETLTRLSLALGLKPIIGFERVED
jgi:transcriptional regulator with XRE-family HTH domain